IFSIIQSEIMKPSFVFLSLIIAIISIFGIGNSLTAQTTDHSAAVSVAANKIEQKVIDWRHDFHQHPELGNNEVRTAGIIAAHLKSLGIDVKTNVAKTGVVGVLVGDKP